MKRYIIALDQGTTSSRAIVFNKSAKIVGFVQKEFTQIYPQPGWVEHDPLEIWASQYGVLIEAMARYNISASEVAGIGITNQRETTVVWDRLTGEPVYNAICWQCRRTADICNKLIEDGFSEYVKENTGLIIDAYFSASKLKWILDNVAGIRVRAEKDELLFGTVDTWLMWKLTNGKVHMTDYTNASRTMMYNIKTLEWDETILKALNIPRSMLPSVHNSSEVYGHTNLGGSGGIRVPIAGVAGDQQAALFGQCCFDVGDAKNTYGTGCFLLMNTGEKMIKSKNGLITTIAIGINGKIQYALEGSVFVAGAAIQWLRDELKIIQSAEETEQLATSIPDNGGVYFVPAFTGIGAPYWDMYARGTIVGLTRGTGRAHIVRAALESICYQSNDLLQAMSDDLGFRIVSLKVDGGAVHNDFLMEFQARISDLDVLRPSITETTAMGAAFLAGLAVGFWKNKDELAALVSVKKIFCPSVSVDTASEYYTTWKKAVDRSLDWLEK